MLITEGYRELNVELHRRVSHYGTFGHEWAPRVEELAVELGASVVLDYGCGKGSLAKALRIPCAEYDPAIPGKDAMPAPADLVVCTDVLEHVEIECVDAVLSHIGSLAQMAALICVSCIPGSKRLADGRQAHITIREPAWWRERLIEIGSVSDIGTLRRGEYACIVKP